MLNYGYNDPNQTSTFNNNYFSYNNPNQAGPSNTNYPLQQPTTPNVHQPKLQPPTNSNKPIISLVSLSLGYGSQIQSTTDNNDEDQHNPQVNRGRHRRRRGCGTTWHL